MVEIDGDDVAQEVCHEAIPEVELHEGVQGHCNLDLLLRVLQRPGERGPLRDLN